MQKAALRRRITQSPGVDLQISNDAKDLGISNAVGKRSLSLFRNRIGKAHARSRRIRRLSLLNRKAATLYNTGAFAQASYGASAYGCGKSTIRKFRTSALHATGIAKGACTYIGIRLQLGDDADPAIRLRTLILKDCIKLWTDASIALRLKIRNIWRRRQHACSGVNRWCNVKGPISALIALVTDLGWDVAAPDVWVRPQIDKLLLRALVECKTQVTNLGNCFSLPPSLLDEAIDICRSGFIPEFILDQFPEHLHPRNTWRIVGNCSLHEFLDDVTQCIHIRLTLVASLHSAGGGLHDGPDLKAARPRLQSGSRP